MINDPSLLYSRVSWFSSFQNADVIWKSFPLVTHAVEEGTVASKFDQLPRRIGADRLLRLAVQIAPVRSQRRLGGNAQRVAGANHRAGFVEHLDEQVSGLADGQAFD